jgi:hypothetical protein
MTDDPFRMTLARFRRDTQAKPDPAFCRSFRPEGVLQRSRSWVLLHSGGAVDW